MTWPPGDVAPGDVAPGDVALAEVARSSVALIVEHLLEQAVTLPGSDQACGFQTPIELLFMGFYLSLRLLKLKLRKNYICMLAVKKEL